MRTLSRTRPLATLVAGLHVLQHDGPRVQRMRSTVRSMSHVFESGAANTAVVAFGWRGAAVVPVVVAVSMVLARILHGRAAQGSRDAVLGTVIRMPARRRLLGSRSRAA